MHHLASVLAQAAPHSGDWVETFLTATGPAGAVAALLWVIRKDERKSSADREVALMAELAEARSENRHLTSRLFLLADRGMDVGKTAAQVAQADPAADSELLAQMQDLRALLEQRGGR